MRGRFSTIDQAKLRRLIEVEKTTQRQAALALGVCKSAIERACKRLGLKTQRTGPRAGDQHTNWKGGRILVGRYYYVYRPSHQMATKRGYVAEHRWIVAERIGRSLKRREAVHHLDGNPLNNHPDNLQLFATNSEHLRHELIGRVPNWTQDGKRRIAEGVAKAASLNRSRAHDRAKLKISPPSKE